MLVKELRQGVQSGVFFWTFLVFQAALFLVFSIQVLTDADDSEGFSILFWLAAFVAVSLVVPLRGIAAISGERAGNGLDLLNLTRLSATRIVVGKWTALVAQSAIVAVTLLPYCTLRYFFGGVDVLTELQGLGWIMAAGAVVAAAAVALSTLPLGFRIGTSIAASAAIVYAMVFGFGLAGGMFGPWWMWFVSPWAILATMAIYTYALLEFAAARIAPSSENHAARKRLFALLLAAIWPIVAWRSDFLVAVATFLATGPLLLFHAFGAVVDRPSQVRTLFLPFRRARVAGRLAAMVFTPGWASGLVFVAVLAGLCMAGVFGLVDRFADAEQRQVTLTLASLLLAAIVFPLPVTIHATQVRYSAVLCFLLHLLGFMTFAFANAFKHFSDPWSGYTIGQFVTLPFPVGAACSFWAVCDSTHVASDRLTAASTYTAAGLVITSVVLVVIARPWLREFAVVGRLLRGDTAALVRSPSSIGMARGRAPAKRPWVWRGDDFPSWLAPMLVRELRQGVQSGVFAWTFIGIQAAMFALMTWAVGSFGGTLRGAPSRDFAVLFWFAIAAAIVVVVPLRGLSAVSSERVGNNLDLVRLSQLSATRIVLGKWLAIAGQGVLVATALLPYLVLRYFLGGVDVVNDLEAFGWLAAASLAVTAAALALSTQPLWMRIGLCLVAAGFAIGPIGEIVQQAMRGRLSFAGLGAAERIGIIAVITVYTVAFLEYAAARIAPSAENHAGRKRLMAVGIAVAWAIVGIFGSSEAGSLTIGCTAPLVLCYMIESLLEEPVPIASLYRPFGKWGTLGRGAAVVFTPGWATALPFVGIVSGLCLVGWVAWVARSDGSSSINERDIAISATIGSLIVSAIIFPTPFLVRLPRIRARFLFYAIVQLVCFLVFVYLSAVAPHDGMRSWQEWGGWVFALPFPLAALPAYMRMGYRDDHLDYAPVFMIASALTMLAVLASVWRRWLGEMQIARRLVGRKPSPPMEPKEIVP